MCRGPVAVPALVPDVIRVKHGRCGEEYRGIPVLLELVAEGVEAATLRDEMSERLQQGVARWAIAGAEAGRFYSTLVLSALINN